MEWGEKARKEIGIPKLYPSGTIIWFPPLCSSFETARNQELVAAKVPFWCQALKWLPPTEQREEGKLTVE